MTPPVVDHQAHWYPAFYLEGLVGAPDWPRATRLQDGGFLYEDRPGASWRFGAAHFDLDVALADMDAHGVDLMVSSPAPLGDVADLPPSEAAAICRLLNDATAAAQASRPDRFLGLAVLPLGDPAAAISELDRAVESLGLLGVCALAGDRSRPLARPDGAPLLARMAELGAPLFLHPSFRSVTADVGFAPGVDIGVGWMADTSALALDLIFSGALERAPGLIVVQPHLGGVVPYLRGRLAEVARRVEVPRSLDEVLRTQFFADAVNNTPGALAMAEATYGPGRILFATDYPWLPRSLTVDHLRAELGDGAARVYESVSPGLLG